MLRHRSVWLYFLSFSFCSIYLLFKIITKLNMRGGSRAVLDSLFFDVFFCLKFMFKRPIWLLLRILFRLYPRVGYRKRMRFGKHLKTKLSNATLGDGFFIKDRRTRKKDKKKVKANKKDAKKTGRKRRYVAPIKHIFTMPWVYSKYSRILTSFKWLNAYFRNSFLGTSKVKTSFFENFRNDFLSFSSIKKIKRITYVKRRMYSILYKTRFLAHFRW